MDILACHPTTRNRTSIEVKTSKKKAYLQRGFGFVQGKWVMSVKNEHVRDKDLFYCFVSADCTNACPTWWRLPALRTYC